jgi:peptidoglycan/xylan/chitin deacetylase (PgdA/CDA1 family)
VTFAKAADTSQSLALRHLGDRGLAWMIDDYMGVQAFSRGEVVVIPRAQWNPPGIDPTGYQLVPILVYHNVGPQRRGQLVLAASAFDAQMRYLQAHGYRPVSLRHFLDYIAHRRQLPRKSVLITFDDNHRGFLEHAHPVLKELGFTATLFVPTDQVGGTTKSGFLTWQELRALQEEGFDIQAHSKTHADLRRRQGEPDAQFAQRMASELGQPQGLFQRHLQRSSETVAYPYGAVNDEVLRHVGKHGYVGGFTVRRQANPAFTRPLQADRSQVYSDWSLEDFVKNLNTFATDDLRIRPAGAPASTASARPMPRFSPAEPEALAAFHHERAQALERDGQLRPALEAAKIALAVRPADPKLSEGRKRLEALIERSVTDQLREGMALRQRGAVTEARRHFLRTLALQPKNRAAFEALQTATALEGKHLVHVVVTGDSLASLATIYYGDASRAEVIAQTNQLSPIQPLAAGKRLRIPEIPGVPWLRPDRQ